MRLRGATPRADALLLAEVDRAHGTTSGPATVHLLKRALHVHGDTRFERLASLSVSHLYNLRHSKIYQNQRVSFTKTRPVVNPIGIRRAPRPDGRPGFIRVDSVHQGDLDGTKGVYTHVNAVDIVTQWEVVANLHRPCLFAKESVDAKGKIRKTYTHDMVQTPLDELASLPSVEASLRQGITIAQLQSNAKATSDLNAANAMNVARLKLFDLFNRRSKSAA